MSTFTIEKSEVDDLNQFLKDLNKEIDVLSAHIEACTPPRSINSTSQEHEKQEFSEHCSTIQYTVVEGDEVDITNVVAYQEVEMEHYDGSGAEYHSKLSQLDTSDEFDSISSSVSLFSPVEPNANYDNNDLSDCCDPDKSLLSISSVDTLCNPRSNDPINCFPCFKFEGSPFHLFSTSQLDASTSNYVNLKNRSVAYYGMVPYSYGKIHHQPRDFSENKYLQKILSYIEIVIPEVKFNSAMVHRYLDGNSYIPHHSDDENSIDNDSNIITISLGDTRDIEFLHKRNKSVSTVTFNHGDVLVMSKHSQQFYSHSIPPMASNKLRLSITLRQLHQPNPTTVSPSTPSTSMDTVTEFLNDISTNRHTEINVCAGEEESNTNALMPSSQGQGTQTQLDMHSYEAETVGPIPLPDSLPPQPSPAPSVDSRFTWQRPGWQPPNRFIPQRQPQGNNILNREPSYTHQPRPGWQPPQDQNTRQSRSAERRNTYHPAPQRSNYTHFHDQHGPRQQPQDTINRQPFLIPDESPVAEFPSSQLHPTRQNVGQRFNHPQNRSKETKNVVFISSSMFAGLDQNKLSSSEFNAHVFYYPGADAFRMKNKLMGDERVQNLANEGNVTKVFLLTGTNNVDSICQKYQSLQQGCSNITNTINYVQSIFSCAEINVLNILPRERSDRIHIIDELNKHIQSVCTRSAHIKFIDTYNIKLLTARNGRRSELFKCSHQNDFDNVHLNSFGVVKFGRHLKYLVHQ